MWECQCGSVSVSVGASILVWECWSVSVGTWCTEGCDYSQEGSTVLTKVSPALSSVL